MSGTIGIVAQWFNRGIGILANQFRGVYDEAGFETAVLALPTKADFIRPGFTSDDDVWQQDRVTRATAPRPPLDEYRMWIAAEGVDTIVTFTNCQFRELAELRRDGIRVVGWFEWESIGFERLPLLRHSFDEMMSLTDAEHIRYRRAGVPSRRVRYGCHPELLDVEPVSPTEGVSFHYPGGFLTARKPSQLVLDTFLAAAPDQARLVMRFQTGLPDQIRAALDDPRIVVVDRDLDTAEHRSGFAGADVLLAPTRWEGLGLHLYEAIAFGIPAIASAVPPMDEVVQHERNGLVVPGSLRGTALSEVPSFEPDAHGLARAIQRLCDPGERAVFAAGARDRRAELPWEQTAADLIDLVRPDESPLRASIGSAGPTAEVRRCGPEPSTPKRYSIVMPLFGRRDLTEQCLVRLFENVDDAEAELILIDNASPDDTPDLLARLDGDITIVTNDVNLGFARACNQGAEVATGDVLLFLNNDTLVTRGWAEPLLAAVESGEADIVGPRLLYPDGQVQHAGLQTVLPADGGPPLPRHVPTFCPIDHPMAASRRIVPAVTGAAFAIARHRFLGLGGFDEGFWNGYEDVDLCARVRVDGGVVLYEPASTFIHLESQSGPERYRLELPNQDRYVRRWAHRLPIDLVQHPDGALEPPDELTRSLGHPGFTAELPSRTIELSSVGA